MITDEELIKVAFLLKEEEDEQLEELLNEMEILFITMMLAFILDVESAMEDILDWDHEDVSDIVNNILEKYPTKAPSKRVIKRHLRNRPFNNNLSDNVVPKLRQAYFDYYDEFNKHYSNEGAEFNYRSRHYKKIDKWLKNLPKTMKLSTDNQVTDLIRQSYEEGKGPKWLESQLAKNRSFTRSRARTTAITENMRMYSAAEFQSFLDNDYIVGKEWRHTHGIKEPREMHVQADGYIVPKDEPFIINGHECFYPRDPDLPPEESISCHCFMVPVFEGESISI